MMLGAGPLVAQTAAKTADGGLPEWAEWLFGVLGAVGTVAAAVGIAFAVGSFRESQRLRHTAARERRLDRAERRLEALERIGVLVHEVSDASQNGRWTECWRARREAVVIVRSNKLGDVVPTVLALVVDTSQDGWRSNLVDIAQAAVSEVDGAIDDEAAIVDELSQSGPDE